MGKALIRHCEADEVLEAFRHERDGVRRAHLQVIWLLLSGEEKTEMARVDDLTDALDGRCSILADKPAILSANTRFHWWPSE